MSEFAVHLEFAKILALVSFIGIFLTGIVYYIFKDKEEYRLLKYIPGLIFILIGLINLAIIGISIPGVDEFNKVLIIVMSMVGGFVAWLTGLIIGVITKTKKTEEEEEA